MAIAQSIMIRGSVGAGGRNDLNDVRNVQQQLNALMRPPRQKLVVDGRCGSKTCGMIRDFQVNVVRLANPDSRVDPAGRTIRALNDPGSESAWARMSIAPAPSGTPGLTPTEEPRLAALRRAAESDPALAPAKDVLDLLAGTAVPVLKMILNALGSAQYGVDLLRAIVILRRAGMSAQDIVLVFRLLAGFGNKTFDEALQRMIAAGAGGGGKLAKFLGVFGKAANFAQALATAVQAADLLRKGQYGEAFGEIYGTVMGMAIPWAGAVNALQEMISAASPAMASSPKFAALFRFILAFDPIACGKTAVDTAVTLLNMAAKGQWSDKEFDALAKRMKNSPLRFWTEVGDYLGDQAFNFVEWLRS